MMMGLSVLLWLIVSVWNLISRNWMRRPRRSATLEIKGRMILMCRMGRRKSDVSSRPRSLE